MTLILCHAPKGGVGTTFVAAQLALSIAKRGLRVAAVDFTYQDALKLHFGLLPNQFTPDFRTSKSEPLVISDVNLLSAYTDKSNSEFHDNLRNGGLPTQIGDVIVADVCSADRELADLLYQHADIHLAAVLPDPAALASLTRLGNDLPIIAREKTAIVFNQRDDRRKLSRHSHRFIRDVFKDQLIGAIRRDEAAPEALALFEQLAKASPNSVILPDVEALTDAVLVRCGLAPHQAEHDAVDAAEGIPPHLREVG